MLYAVHLKCGQAPSLCFFFLFSFLCDVFLSGTWTGEVHGYSFNATSDTVSKEEEVD